MSKTPSSPTTPSSPAPRMWFVEMFGEIRVDHNSQPVQFRSKAAAHLFCYLILQPGNEHRRDRIQAALWPDDGQDEGANNLRVTLSRLRSGLKALSDDLPVVITRTTVKLLPEKIVCDAVEFDATLRAARDATDPARRRHLLEQGIGHYRDALLAGYDADWARAERQFREERYLSALGELFEMAVRSRRQSDAVDYAHQILRTDPYQEEVSQWLAEQRTIKAPRPEGVTGVRESADPLTAGDLLFANRYAYSPEYDAFQRWLSAKTAPGVHVLSIPQVSGKYLYADAINLCAQHECPKKFLATFLMLESATDPELDRFCDRIEAYLEATPLGKGSARPLVIAELPMGPVDIQGRLEAFGERCKVVLIRHPESKWEDGSPCYFLPPFIDRISEDPKFNEILSQEYSIHLNTIDSIMKIMEFRTGNLTTDFFANHDFGQLHISINFIYLFYSNTSTPMHEEEGLFISYNEYALKYINTHIVPKLSQQIDTTDSDFISQFLDTDFQIPEYRSINHDFFKLNTYMLRFFYILRIDDQTFTRSYTAFHASIKAIILNSENNQYITDILQPIIEDNSINPEYTLSISRIISIIRPSFNTPSPYLRTYCRNIINLLMAKNEKPSAISLMDFLICNLDLSELALIDFTYIASCYIVLNCYTKALNFIEIGQSVHKNTTNPEFFAIQILNSSKMSWPSNDEISTFLQVIPKIENENALFFCATNFINTLLFSPDHQSNPAINELLFLLNDKGISHKNPFYTPAILFIHGRIMFNNSQYTESTTAYSRSIHLSTINNDIRAVEYCKFHRERVLIQQSSSHIRDILESLNRKTVQRNELSTIGNIVNLCFMLRAQSSAKIIAFGYLYQKMAIADTYIFRQFQEDYQAISASIDLSDDESKRHFYAGKNMTHQQFFGSFLKTIDNFSQ